MRAHPSCQVDRSAIHFVLVALACFPWGVQARYDIAGRATVIDGDTIEMRGQRIRLWGIDAPEGQQRCVKDGKLWRAHADSANALDSYVADRPVTCKQKAIDRYKRIVAICVADGVDIGAWMVRMGWVYDFPRYSNGYYAAEQAEAKAYRRGLWQGECEMPWDWRRNR